MTAAVEIRDASSKRVFDVNVNESGEILDYEIKNGKLKFKVSGQEVKKQIAEMLKQNKKLNS